ncbi:MAG: hypothetical protein M1334_01170 [Patescibacteria group bacterium]|nr:hypothetical protein [Patescibacteria group bacterium]
MKKIYAIVLLLILINLIFPIIFIKAADLGSCDPTISTCNNIQNFVNSANQGGAGTAAGNTGSSGGGLPNPLGSNSLQVILSKILSNLVVVIVPIAVIIIIYGAFQMLTAAGNPDKFTKGRMTILYAAIGIGIVLLADSIVIVIKSVLGV